MTASKTYLIVVMGICVALICLGSWISIPIGPIPITLQMFVIPLVIFLLPAKWAVCTILAFLLLGAVGVPVFSGFKGGIGSFMGPTGGFLLGYIPATAVAAYALGCLGKKAGSRAAKLASKVACGVAFTLIADFCGMLQYAAITGMDLWAAFAVAVLPFILPDVVKVALAAICSEPLSKVVKL